MGKSARAVSIAVVLLFALLLTCGSRGAQTGFRPSEQEVLGNDVGGDIVEGDTAAFVDNGEEKDRDPIVTAVMNGDTESLLGIRFGDPLNSELFEEVYDGEYRRKDIDDGWTYYFDAKGNRFSGLASSFKGTYFGLELDVDTKEKVRSMFGEPDEISIHGWSYERNKRKITLEMYIYHFPMADLEMMFYNETNTLTSRIWYTATSEALALNPLIETGPTDFEIAIAEGCDTAEIIYQWQWFSGDEMYTVSYEDYDERQIEELVEDYLREQGMKPEQPAGEVYDQDGQLFFVYYFDEIQERYCFVLYDYFEVDCVTCDLADAKMAGSLTSSVDESTGIVTETQYDRWGRDRIAEVSYRKEEGFPFPIIVESWENGLYLCRDAKMWFYEDAIVYDGNGRIASYQGDEKYKYESRFWYPSDFSYDADGRLVKIMTEARETDFDYTEYGRDYLASMNFVYNGDGELEEADYWFSEWSHGGTADNNGDIWYDSQGRMIYNTFYMTHGSHKVFYLYKDGEERPWAIAEWCGMDGFTLNLFESVD